MSKGSSFVGMPAHLRLDAACGIVNEALGETSWLVGSALKHNDWRDVDVRVLMDDDKFDNLFGDVSRRANPFWSLFCMSVSEYLRAATDLPVDFQVHPRSAVTETDWEKVRYPLGCHVNTADTQPPWRRKE